ncbi:citrate synthase [Colletotrichum truncatum]|uniref:Citrate synthase n=1 Tax=Colletotrichum truncatum TaxID=5467 RepID=A0ACC3YZ39_COLTU|nr:citrate synthase [Colletotrichum truncatum]KAF6786343.1 citrate synthase [Colletotrichum truncatum]
MSNIMSNYKRYNPDFLWHRKQETSSSLRHQIKFEGNHDDEPSMGSLKHKSSQIPCDPCQTSVRNFKAAAVIPLLYLFKLLRNTVCFILLNLMLGRKLMGASIWLIYHLFGQTAVGPSFGTLTVLDNRTKRQYQVQIKNNTIEASQLRNITASQGDANLVDSLHSGLRILDPGYLNTACIESRITFVDGSRGYKQYREHSIEYLVEKHDYEEVIYLLIWGHLPTALQKKDFQRAIAERCIPPQHVVQTIASFPRDSLTSTILVAGIAAYASHDEGAVLATKSRRPAFSGQLEKVDNAVINCISALATVVALVYCHKRNKAFTPANSEDSLIGNAVRMMGFHRDGEDTEPNPEIVKCFEKLWILYADHEMTNSTVAFLHAASTLTDPLSCCVSGIVSAYGPLHGGAIDLAYKTFEDLQSPDNVPALISDVKSKKQRLFGYGHRIYKAIDPRVKLIRALMDQHKDKVESNPLLSVAMEIDRVANAEEYFTSRALKANADLYGCFLYTALGFETDIIVAMACLSRTPGVLAHWREMMLEKSPLLWRPQQVFTGKRSTEHEQVNDSD